VAIARRAVEEVDVSRGIWAGKRVLLTGHTGFKGGWLALWLHEMGAEVHGYALQPPTTPSLFQVACVDRCMASSTIADVRDLPALTAAVRAAKPEIVFHLAAQPLVRESYRSPVETYATNVMGTVHLLEALRGIDSVRGVVNVTTDKCYENDGRSSPYLERDPMGGHDPYSSSKGCAELVTAAYRRSFLSERKVHVATARAGNVIGGGDWAPDRLVPDFLRSLDAGQEVVIRSPDATRPWQHVLEPLSGYLMLAERLWKGGAECDGAWNFGPALEDAKPVRWIVERLCAGVPGASWRVDLAPQPHEARALTLDSAKARDRLGWRPRWGIERALDRTLAWHRAWRAGADMRKACLEQIAEYKAAA
jgi:CDP-glucose 4,6-dehydratase